VPLLTIEAADGSPNFRQPEVRARPPADDERRARPH
jgi:hypothetical protein